MSMRRCVTVPPVGGGCSALDLTVGAHTDGERAALVGLGDELIKRGPKWHAALGGVDGFDHQVIYSSLCAPLFDIAEPAIRSGAYRARNRAMATAELDAALDLGLRLVWIPARAPGSRAPGHPLHDPFWTRLAERRVPFVLHVGSGPLAIGDAWMDDGRHAAEQMIGAEIIGSKDVMAVHHPAQRFVSVLLCRRTRCRSGDGRHRHCPRHAIQRPRLRHRRPRAR